VGVEADHVKQFRIRILRCANDQSRYVNGVALRRFFTNCAKSARGIRRLLADRDLPDAHVAIADIGLERTRLDQHHADANARCELDSTMETIQIVLDEKLLQAADEAARRTKRNRSALVRDALREHLRSLEVSAKEERDRRGYSRRPQTSGQARRWEAEAAWPAE